MRNERGTIDWQATEERAAHMSADELFGAIADIHKTLPNADALDRTDGGDRGGYYRDEASVYHREIAKRRESRLYELFARKV